MVSRCWKYSSFHVGVDAVEQQGLGGAEGVKHLALRLGDIDVLQFVEGARAGGQGVGAEGREVGQSSERGGGLVVGGGLGGLDLGVAGDAFLPELEAEVLAIARQELREELLAVL